MRMMHKFVKHNNVRNLNFSENYDSSKIFNDDNLRGRRIR